MEKKGNVVGFVKGDLSVFIRLPAESNNEATLKEITKTLSCILAGLLKASQEKKSPEILEKGTVNLLYHLGQAAQESLEMIKNIH